MDPFLQTRFDVTQGLKMFEALDVHDRESILKCLNEITLSLSEELQGDNEISTLTKVWDALNKIEVDCSVLTTSGGSTKLKFNGLECFKGKEKM